MNMQLKKDHLAVYITIIMLAASILTTNAVAHYRLNEAIDDIATLNELWDKREERVKLFYREYDAKEKEDEIANEQIVILEQDIQKLKLTVECLRVTSDSLRNC